MRSAPPAVGKGPERCHCGRVAWYRVRPSGEAFCRVHRPEALQRVRAITVAIDHAQAHERHNWREGHRHAPEASPGRWR